MNKKTIIILGVAIIIIIAVVIAFIFGMGSNIEESVLGTWECTSASGGKMYTDIITIYKGGTGRYQQLVNGNPGGGNSSATWEIKDGVLNVTVLAWSGVYAYTYDSEGDTLTLVDGSKVFTRSKS